MQSCLDQTYKPIEIIVIDDGSTDESLKILLGFGDKIILESGPNRGGNHARNRGFALSSGKYIQYLDADDYLLPDKIECQVRFLEDTGADAVYGDWRPEYHSPDNTSYLDEIRIEKAHGDTIEWTLNFCAPPHMTFLLKSEVVAGCEGWDESIRCGQDWDFDITIALQGADIRYQTGCGSVYRRYGDVTVSTLSPLRLWRNCFVILSKAESKLRQSQNLSEKYRIVLAKQFFKIGRANYEADPHLFSQCLEKTLQLCPDFKPQESVLYNCVQRVWGFKVAESIGSSRRRIYEKMNCLFRLRPRSANREDKVKVHNE